MCDTSTIMLIRLFLRRIEIWHFISQKDGWGSYDEPEFSEDRTACLLWEKEPFDVKNFRLLCKQCCGALRDHSELLSIVPEFDAVAAMPVGPLQWIRLIHQVAGSNPVWAGLVNKLIVVSARPFTETQETRVCQWSDEDALIEPNESESQLVNMLRDQGKTVPDIWFEYIPRPIAPFHSHMVDILFDLARESYVTEFCEGDQLKKLQKNLILSLGEKKLATEVLCAELTALTGFEYSSSGNVKGALANLVDRGFMASDKKGYTLTDLGLQVYRRLPRPDRRPD